MLNSEEEVMLNLCPVHGNLDCSLYSVVFLAFNGSLVVVIFAIVVGSMSEMTVVMVVTMVAMDPRLK